MKKADLVKKYDKAKVEKIDHPDHNDLYRVEVTDTHERVIDVHAKNEAEAKEKAVEAVLGFDPVLRGFEVEDHDARPKKEG